MIITLIFHQTQENGRKSGENPLVSDRQCQNKISAAMGKKL